MLTKELLVVINTNLYKPEEGKLDKFTLLKHGINGPFPKLNKLEPQFLRLPNDDEHLEFLKNTKQSVGGLKRSQRKFRGELVNVKNRRKFIKEHNLDSDFSHAQDLRISNILEIAPAFVKACELKNCADIQHPNWNFAFDLKKVGLLYLIAIDGWFIKSGSTEATLPARYQSYMTGAPQHTIDEDNERGSRNSSTNRDCYDTFKKAFDMGLNVEFYAWECSKQAESELEDFSFKIKPYTTPPPLKIFERQLHFTITELSNGIHSLWTGQVPQGV